MSLSQETQQSIQLISESIQRLMGASFNSLNQGEFYKSYILLNAVISKTGELSDIMLELSKQNETPQEETIIIKEKIEEQIDEITD